LAFPNLAPSQSLDKNRVTLLCTAFVVMSPPLSSPALQKRGPREKIVTDQRQRQLNDYLMITRETGISYFGGMHNFRFEPYAVSTRLAILDGPSINSFGGRDFMKWNRENRSL
jgi:hypothetical protein